VDNAVRVYDGGHVGAAGRLREGADVGVPQRQAFQPTGDSAP